MNPKSTLYKFQKFELDISDGVRINAVISFLIGFISFFSFGNFSGKIIEGNEMTGASQIQTAIILLVWGVIGAVILIDRMRWRSNWSNSRYLLVFLCYAASSVFWGSGVESLLKAFVLVFVSYVIFVVAHSLSISLFFSYVRHALFLLVFFSLVVSVIRPDIGVVDHWMHEGQWSGIFQSKQSLGFACALYVYMMAVTYRDKYKYYHWVSAFVAIFVLIMSGSRGGGVVALFAVLLFYINRNGGKGVLYIYAAWVFLVCALGFYSVYYFYGNRLPFFDFFGFEVDLTERTYIWQYALSWMDGKLFLGYGLNSFWSRGEVSGLFEREFEWFLDNYHSGYVGLFVELGLLGLIVFSFVVARLIFLIFAFIKIESSSSSSEFCELMGLVCLILTANLTESFLLRSTSFYQVFLTYSLIRVEILYASRLKGMGDGY